MKNLKAIIFDMDGTLIDTEKYYRIFWKKAAGQCGYPMTDEQALAMRSLGRPFAPMQLKAWFGEAANYQKVRNCAKEMVEECLKREGIRCKSGALALLAWLKDRHITTAVATAAGLERARDYLNRAGLLEYFDRIISATEVREGKPSPDIYIYACEQLQASPQDCYAVEDSPNGILSAYRAGCKVIMVPDQTQPDEELSKCLYAKVDSLEEIRELLMDEV